MNLPTRADIRTGLSRMTGVSPAVQAILPRLGDSGFDVNELGSMVAKDPLLAARVLRLANSPFYGLARQVSSLRDAVVVLGFSNLRSVLLSAGLIGAFTDKAAVARSLATAAAARSLAKSMKRDPGMACTAGLLHNLGGLLMGHFAAETWQALDGEPMESASSRLLKERETFGFDHCELGADIAGDWRFPEVIQTAIRWHLQPQDEPSDELADLVHVAWVTSANGLADENPVMLPAALRRLQLDTPAGEAILAMATQAALESHGTLDEL